MQLPFLFVVQRYSFLVLVVVEANSSFVRRACVVVGVCWGLFAVLLEDAQDAYVLYVP